MAFLQQMVKVFNYCGILILLLLFSNCTPIRRDCNTKPRENASLSFQVKDKNTGLPLVAAPTSRSDAPDSIQLKNIATNTRYSLKMSAGAYFDVSDYKGRKGTVDLLEFRFGNAKPDTLQVTIAIIDGWRGDECGFVDDPGITEVKQNGTIIYVYQKYLDSAFVLKK
jgi:hypothetical protein